MITLYSSFLESLPHSVPAKKKNRSPNIKASKQLGKLVDDWNNVGPISHWQTTIGQNEVVPFFCHAAAIIFTRCFSHQTKLRRNGGLFGVETYRSIRINI